MQSTDINQDETFSKVNMYDSNVSDIKTDTQELVPIEDVDFPIFNPVNPQPFQTIGLFTYLRTYARRHNEEDPNSTIESWKECIERVVKSCNKQLKVGFTTKEINEVFDLLYNLKGSVAGRFLWQLGTKTVDRLGLPSLQNCFMKGTKFVTHMGVKSFQDFKDGDVIKVRSRLEWREATVKSYGEQKIVELTVCAPGFKEVIHTTANHRWIIDNGDGSFTQTTTSVLCPGEKLLISKEIGFNINWVVESVRDTNRKEIVWCVEEPIENIFTLANGIVTMNCAATVIDEPITPFTWVMDMLMLGCVPPDTPIVTENGLKPIKDIKVGDKVWSFNQKTKENELKTVVKLHDVKVSKEENIKIKLTSGEITTSKEHPLLVYRNDWEYVLAGDIKVGDIMRKYTCNNSENIRIKVIDIETNLNITEDFKDITVEDNNSYYAGDRVQIGSHNCGVGYRLLPEDIEKLPIIKHVNITRKDTKDADFIVPDSREGWVKLLGKLMKAHFYSGKDFTYSCTLLRSKGAPIKSFGGIASGPDVLCDGISKINTVLNKRAGLAIRPIDALDVMNIIGMIVVSG